MTNSHFSLFPSSEGRSEVRLLSISAFLSLVITGWLLTIQFPSVSYFAISLGCLYIRVPIATHYLQMAIAKHPCLQGLGGYRRLGLVFGTVLFLAITTHASPALAQIFDTAEDEVETIFGEYLDTEIITFLFGLIRVVIWVAAVGFVFFAIYQAQRGEQWQPLAQNAFIIVAAVVLVEGLSALFFGDGVGGGTGDGGGT